MKKNIIKTFLLFLALFGLVSQSSASFPSGPIHYYNGDSSSFYIDSIGSLTGSINGAIYTSSGISNGSYDFDGINDYIELGYTGTLDLTSDYSFSLWINPDDVNNVQGIITDIYSGTNKKYGISLQGDVLRYDYEVGNNNEAELGSISITPGEWTHIVTTLDSSLELKVYVDSVLDFSYTFPAETLSNTEPVSIGRWGGTYNSNYYKGLIDELSIFTGTLTSTDVSNLYNGGSGIFYSGTSNLDGKTCTSFPVNFSYPDDITIDTIDNTIDDSEYYALADTDDDIVRFLNFRSHTGSLTNVFNSTGSFLIDDKLNPLGDNLFMTVESLVGIDTFKIEATTSSAYNTYFVNDCNATSGFFGDDEDLYFDNPENYNESSPTIRKQFEYGERYNLDSSYSSLCFQFPVDWLASIDFTSIKVGQNQIQVEEILYCEDDTTGDISYGFDENGSDLESYTGSIDDIGKNGGDVLENDDERTLYYSFESEFIGLFEQGSVIRPEESDDGTCPMFTDSGSFIYYSDGEFGINFTLNSLNIPESISFVGDKIANLIIVPVNSVISVLAIITPLVESDDGTAFCIMGYTVEYQNHVLFKGTDKYNEMWLLDYLFLFGFYTVLFMFFLSYKGYIGPPHHDEYQETGEKRSVIVRDNRKKKIKSDTTTISNSQKRNQRWNIK